jgi:hypothetical protein
MIIAPVLNRRMVGPSENGRGGAWHPRQIAVDKSPSHYERQPQAKGPQSGRAEPGHSAELSLR